MITEKAYAKINLTLNITGKRDDGYHTLDTVMQTVSLYDTVTVGTAEQGVITVGCDRVFIPGSKNIAHKAAAAFFAALKLSGGARIVINKTIPVRGGFGGGSADAAAVLRCLNKLYKTGLSGDTLREIALPLGADVPFLIEGGTCHCKGIGEIMTPVKTTENAAYCVCASGKGASTARMFGEIDKHNISVTDSIKMLEALSSGDIRGVVASLHNDFMPICRKIFPSVSFLEGELYKNGALGVSLTGSGTGVFGVFESFDAAQTAADTIGKHAFAKAVTPINRTS